MEEIGFSDKKYGLRVPSLTGNGMPLPSHLAEIFGDLWKAPIESEKCFEAAAEVEHLPITGIKFNLVLDKYSKDGTPRSKEHLEFTEADIKERIDFVKLVHSKLVKFTIDFEKDEEVNRKAGKNKSVALLEALAAAKVPAAKKAK